MPRPFKAQYTATLDDAIKIQRRFQRTLKDESYLVALFGSTIRKGSGHDVDILISAADGATKNVHEIGWMLLVHCKKLIWWEVTEHDYYQSDLFLNFVTHDNLYVDVFLRGIT